MSSFKHCFLLWCFCPLGTLARSGGPGGVAPGQLSARGQVLNWHL